MMPRNNKFDEIPPNPKGKGKLWKDTKEEKK